MKIVFLESIGISDDMQEKLAKKNLAGADVVFYRERTDDTEELIRRSRDADIVVLTNQPFGREVIKECPRLKMIAAAFTGYDHIDMEYCREKGIIVCNCAGYANEAVAELVFGSAIAFFRRLPACDLAVRQGQGRESAGRELSGRKFGVIGTGAIGGQVAKIAAAFGCEVYVYSRTIREDMEIPYIELEELVRTCDIISVHVPYDSSTKGMISKRLIGQMKKNALFINTARGPIVDYEALAQALNEERIGGACIDVFETEPPILPEHPLLHAKNVLLTPHIGFYTKEALEKRAEIVFDNIAAYVKGKPVNVCPWDDTSQGNRK